MRQGREEEATDVRGDGSATLDRSDGRTRTPIACDEEAKPSPSLSLSLSTVDRTTKFVKVFFGLLISQNGFGLLLP